MLLEINPNIFNVNDPQADNLRPHVPHTYTDNPYNHCIDFTQLDTDKLSKEVKNILFRPKKVAKLGQAYMKLATGLTNSFERKR